MKQIDTLHQPAPGRIAVLLAGQPQQGAGDLDRGSNKIQAPGGDRAARHAVEISFLRILSDPRAACGPCAAISACGRKSNGKYEPYLIRGCDGFGPPTATDIQVPGGMT